MNTELPFPIISTEGNPYEIGYQYGSQAKALIEESANNYRKVFKERGTKIEWDEITALAKKFVPYVEEYDPDAVEEMKGMAEGAGVSLEDIMIINARTEFSALGTGKIEEPEGCTVIVATPEVTANHHMLMAQNCDQSPGSQKALVLVKKKKKGKPNTVAIHEAGMVMKTGFNSAGIVCLGNGITADSKIRFGIPVTLLVAGSLTEETLAGAVRKCLPAKRAKACNKVIGSAEGLCVDVEVGLDFENLLMPEDGILVHTNHFLIPQPNLRDMSQVRNPNTVTRRYRALQLLTAERGHITVDTFKRVLTDHVDKPDSICTHLNPQNPVLQYQTNISVIVDINAKTMDVAKGPPCQYEYVHLDFNDMF